MTTNPNMNFIMTMIAQNDGRDINTKCSICLKSLFAGGTPPTKPCSICGRKNYCCCCSCTIDNKFYCIDCAKLEDLFKNK